MKQYTFILLLLGMVVSCNHKTKRHSYIVDDMGGHLLRLCNYEQDWKVGDTVPLTVLAYHSAIVIVKMDSCEWPAKINGKIMIWSGTNDMKTIQSK